MESNDEFNIDIKRNIIIEIDIKNRTRYYFDDVVRVEDLDFHDILLEEKSYKIHMKRF